MDNNKPHRYYQSAFQSVNFANGNFTVSNPAVTSYRAAMFIADAKKLIQRHSNPTLQQQRLINQSLQMAIDYGSAKAAYLLAERILAGIAGDDYLPQDALEFMALAADWGDANACRRLAKCYAGDEGDVELLRAGESYLAVIKPEERQLLANYYGDQVNISSIN